MKIDALCWESVTVTCPSDPSKAMALDRCYVLFNGEDGTLRIWERDGSDDVMYARAKMNAMDSFIARFDASWFGDVNGVESFVPVEVTCRF